MRAASTGPSAAIVVGPFAPPRHDLVLRYVREMHQGMAGWVDSSEIDLTNNATRSWIDAQHGRLGRPAGSPVRPGYYLFLDGQVWAYHSELIDFKHDKVSIGVGIAAGLAALYRQSVSLFDQAFHAARFQGFLARHPGPRSTMAERRQHPTRQAPHQAPPPPPPRPREAAIDALALALEFEVLGLAPSATQDEVRARFRALAKGWHPDRFTNDAPKSAEAGVGMTQINVAYSVICEARGGS